MADISQYTDKIRHAVYGKEVRGSLADGIEAINTEVEANTKHVNDTSTDIQNFKNEINQAESIRVQDENERKSNETNRINEFDSMKNEFNSLKNNSTEATNNANNAANNANSTATNSENRTSQAINDLTNKVNQAVTNVTANQIGGTNILTGTQNFDYGWILGENGVDAKIDRTNLFQGCAVEVLWYDWNYFYQDVNYEVGRTYTISCYAKADKEGANIYFSLADNMTAWGMKKLTTEWKRYVFTFTPTLSTGSLRIECSGVSDNNKAYVSKIKLEKGTMATDWCPSPFDKQDRIKNFGGTNLLDNTDLANPIQMFYNTPNIQLIVDKTFQRQTSIYNEKLIGLQSAGDSFGDTYTSLFRTNDKIIQPNTTYTISFNYMSLHAAGDISSSCFLYFNKNDGTQENLYMDVDLASHGENWFKYVKTFTTPANIKNIEVRFGFRCTAFAWLTIDGLKLEKGTIATDYSLSNTDIKNKLEKASIDNAPVDHNCNSFIQPNSSFLWDTGLDGFKNTPLGDLEKGSAIVFEVVNYGNDGRIQQEFRQTYPFYQTRKWIRNYTSDSNGQWSDWRPEFLGCGPIGQGDDFNGMTSMGCYKVQAINPFTKNSPLTLDNGIYGFGLLNVYESGVAEEHRILQIYYPHQSGTVGHRTPVMRMKNSTGWTDWTYIGATLKDIDRLTSQIASNSSSINDLYNWVNRNVQMEYISGATSLTLQPNKAYYLDGQHVADITHIDHSAIPAGGKVYFYVASGDPLAHIVFRRSGLCNQDVRVWLPKGQDFWITGNENGDTIFTLMKIGDAMRFLS
ncbi:phage head spike fiber domain-containing protein [Clostridium thermobutyricum]|uniref:Carbohydrate binding domain protein n=1 Tax=Clostridium thermobutyricum DSM 4928 TaxID=1121339 RepID=A0A1V4SWF7_9CLOT|nr:carbohydrate binding domain-containing protein [Clostridium thermobutyricum]OPX47896.1 carbohydrate binding domain protein [Clostridium thermobutyricum DSM 4928]